MYKQRISGWLKHWDFLLADLIMYQLAFVITYMIRHQGTVPYTVPYYARLAIVIAVIDVVMVFITETYSGIMRRTYWRELRSSIVSATTVFVAVLLYLTLTKQMETFSRQVLFTFWGAAAIFVFFERQLIKRIIRRRLINSKNRSVMILVTMADMAETLIDEFTHDIYREFDVHGVVIIDKDMRGQEILGVPVVAKADDFYDYIKTNVVDEVFIQGGSKESTESFSQELLDMGLTVHYSVLRSDSVVADHLINRMGGYMVLTQSLRIASSSKLLIKRVFDIIGAIFGLIITGIIFVIFAPIIAFSSKGGIFFAQDRVGQNGRKFKLYKFRSMYIDAEERKAALAEQNEMDGPMFKMKNDPRITPIGRFMRKFSLDEFPQFLNVLKGDMSLVGTRPPTVSEVADYDARHMARLSVRPGITGLWQVSGRSDITDFEEIVRLDKKYITEWSLWLDVQILFKTIWVVLTARGSE